MRFLPIALFAGCAFAFSAVSVPADAGHPALRRAVERVAAASDAPGFQFAVARLGTLVDAISLGWADEATKTPVNDATLFALASCSKPLTAMALMTLVDENKVSLDTKVFPFLELSGARDPRLADVTVGELLNHSAGFPHDIAATSGDPMEVARRATTVMLRFAPGTQQEYSNAGFNIAGAVVEKASGEDYHAYVQEHVFAPAGVTDAAWLDRGRPISAEATRYDEAGQPVVDTRHVGALTPAGGWVLSATDMVKILSAYNAGKIVSQASVAAMLAPPQPPLQARKDGSAFGLGWDVVARESGGIYYGKNGGLDGAHTWIEHRPDGVVVAVFYNGGNGIAAHRPGLEPIEKILDRLAEQPI